MVDANQIEISVSGGFKTEHVFNAPEGTLGSVKIKGGKGEGVFTGTENLVLEFKKPSVWKNQYELHEGKETIARAEPLKKMKPDFQIGFDDQVYHLSPGGNKARSWTMRTSQGDDVYEVLPKGGLKRGAIIEIKTKIPLSLLVFGYCLVVRRWQEDAFSGDGLDMD
jgi:hypothetical protein